MPVLDKKDSPFEEIAPGIKRWELVNGERGAESLTVADVILDSGTKVPIHTHPTEEAMVVLEGDLDAILGDEVIPVTSGQTVVAPPGVKHGFVNQSGATARVMAIFPTGRIERTLVK